MSFGFWVTSVWNFGSKKLEIARSWSLEGSKFFWDFQGFWGFKCFKLLKLQIAMALLKLLVNFKLNAFSSSCNANNNVDRYSLHID